MVRSMIGWWCREEDSTGYTHHNMESGDGMPSDDAAPDLMHLEWLL